MKNLNQELNTLISEDKARLIRIKKENEYYITTEAELYVLNTKDNSVTTKKPYKRNAKGYLAYSIHKLEYVHRLVAEAFLEDFSEHLQVNHINKNVSDNGLSNLEMCNNDDNKQHAIISDRMNWIVSIAEIRAMQEAKQSDNVNVIVEALDFHKSITHFLHDAEEIA